VRGKKGRHEKLLEQAKKDGYVRVRVDGKQYDLSEEISLDKNVKHNIEIIVDRLVVKAGIGSRLADSIENAFKLSEGLMYAEVIGGEMLTFSQHFACPDCGISIDEVFDLVSELGGVAYPAHINRDSYSILTNLGGIPDNYKGRYLEITGSPESKNCSSGTAEYFKPAIRDLLDRGYQLIRSSDAHYLGDILESGNYLDLENKSIRALLNKIKQL
jgi:hypothetical protein